MRLLWVGILAVATASAAQQPCTLRPQSVAFNVKADPDFRLQIRLGNGPRRMVQVDTGSVGIAIWETYIGESTPATDVTLPPVIGYNSSGRKMVGRWVYTTVELSDSVGNTVTTSKIPVLAVHRVECGTPCEDWQTQLKDLETLGMMGVGFDRGPMMGRAKENPFLHLQQMDAGSMQSAYVITTQGITFGTTPADVAGFQFLPLQSLAGQPGEWTQATGCVAITGGGGSSSGKQTCGRVLMDTGVDTMYVSYAAGQRPTFNPPLPPTQNLPPCTDGNPANCANVSVTWPNASAPSFTYGVTVPATFVWNQPNPLAIHLSLTPYVPTPGDAPSDVFVNTSRQLLYDADYLYDATCGRIGFRPHGASGSP